MDYIALGKNIKKYRRFAGLRQIDLPRKQVTAILISDKLKMPEQLPSLEAIRIAIANTLSVTSIICL